MNPWTSASVLFVSCSVWLGHVHTADVRQNFMTEFSGVFNDAHQISDGLTDRDVMEFRISRVDVPALKPALSLYLVERVNGQVYRRMVLGVSPADGKKLLVVQYNISESTYPSSTELGPADFSAMTRDDLETRPGCQAVFVELTPRVFSGNWADCRHVVNGERPLYLFTITCKGLTLETPQDAREIQPIVPYDLRRVADSPQATDARASHVGPCSGKQ